MFIEYTNMFYYLIFLIFDFVTQAVMHMRKMLTATEIEIAP